MEDPSRRRWSSKIPLGRGRRHRPAARLLDGSGGPRSRPNKRQQHEGGDFFPLFFCSESEISSSGAGEVVVEKGGVEWRGEAASQPGRCGNWAPGFAPRRLIRPRPRNRARARADRACLRVFIHGRCRVGGPHAIGAVRIARRGTAATGLEQCGMPSERAMLLLPACVAV